MSLNILIVDDSDVIRAMIARTIKLASVPLGDVFQAANGREALQVLKDEWVDLVLADLNMPVMDGVEMLERMRANPETADVPVIIVSTEGATQRLDDLAARGISAWVRKPFTPEEIRDVIEGVTEHWRPRAEAGRLLDEVFARVLEGFTFSFSEKSEEHWEYADESEVLCADIVFSGAVDGRMEIVAPTGLCIEMAANVLAVEPADGAAVQRGADTLAELLNMTAGHLCSVLEPHAPTRLFPPAVSRLTSREIDELEADWGIRSYLVDEQPVLIRLALQSKPSKAGA